MFMCMSVLPLHPTPSVGMCVPYAFLVPSEAGKGHQIPFNRSYEPSATMWVLGIRLRSSARAVSALNHGVISPGFRSLLFMTRLAIWASCSVLY